ncbi:MAG: triose-phosphate isomerase [Candidatus Gastranaerophilales bacterium]
MVATKSQSQDKIVIGKNSGAYTGEISVEMLADSGCDYVIIGHSERRQYFSETDEMINKKAKAILAGGLIPIICCGESLEQREAGVTDSHIESQIKAALEGISSDDVANSVIAYEPIWAIGTGKTCDTPEANRVIAMIRNVVKEVCGDEASEEIRILYGGSVKPSSIEEQLSTSDIDGALVGGASLKAEDFTAILANAMKVAVVR